MIHLKTPAEIEKMEKGGKILGEVLSEVIKNIKPGISEIKLDHLAEKLILEKGGEPGFKRVSGYKHTICTSTNDVVVHGIPGEYKVKKGDVVGIDCGVFYGGLNTDMSETIQVGEDPKVGKFLSTGKRALEEAIRMARIGNRVGHISKIIQDVVEKEGGYSVVRSLIGHGVGKKLHEDPEVPGFLNEPIDDTPLLREGMTIAIEVIYNMGGPDVEVTKDGWTIKTSDKTLSGVFERTIAITSSKPLILTPESAKI